MTKLAAGLAALTLLATAAPARAFDDDPRVTQRGATLPGGAIEAWVPLTANLASGEVGEPFLLHPGVYFGVADGLTVGIRHLAGICLGGSDRGCSRTYNDASAEVLVGLGRSEGSDLALRLAVNAAPIASQDDAAWSGEAGVTVKLRGPFVSVGFSPSVTFGLNDRDARQRRNALAFPVSGAAYQLVFPGPVTSNRDFLSAPATLTLQLLPMLAVTAGLAYQAELDPQVGNFGDRYAVPLLLAASVSATGHLEVGASLLYQDLLGSDGSGRARLGTVWIGLRN
ncbi:MAG: hypothetical protein QM704_13470 [Anaeromyxobacteraceae bacterium]